MPTIRLASASPRRRELLGLITTDFTICPSEADETIPAGMTPEQAVKELSLRKARAVVSRWPGDVVIGSDTVVTLDGAVLGKPKDQADACRMLGLLSGREHRVYTGVAICRGEEEIVFAEGAAVRFAALSAEEIASYVAGGEPMDKAGAYGIQGRGALLIEGITGDYYAVMGLPVCRLNRELNRFFPKKRENVN